MNHNPRYAHDCKRCKFNWNCAPQCVCQVELDMKHKAIPYVETPHKVKLWANKVTHKAWEGKEKDSSYYAIPYPELESERYEIRYLTTGRRELTWTGLARNEHDAFKHAVSSDPYFGYMLSMDTIKG